MSKDLKTRKMRTDWAALQSEFGKTLPLICCHEMMAPHPPIRPMYMVLSCFSCVRLFATLWTVACQAPLSEGFSRQEYWGGLPCPPPGDLSDPGIKPASSVTPALQKDSFTTEPLGKPKKACRKHQKDSWISLKKANKVRFGQERKKPKGKT